MTNRTENRFFAALFAATVVAIVLVVAYVDTAVTVVLRDGIAGMFA